MHRWASQIVAPFDIRIQDIADDDCAGLVRTVLGLAVVLVYHYSVTNVHHQNVAEHNSWNQAWPSLPCLYPYTIVWVPYGWVCHSYVRDPCTWVVNSKASYAATLTHKFVVCTPYKKVITPQSFLRNRASRIHEPRPVVIGSTEIFCFWFSTVRRFVSICQPKE